MILFYCNKCGKRIAPAEASALGLSDQSVQASVLCQGCAGAQQAAASVLLRPGSASRLPLAETSTLKTPSTRRGRRTPNAPSSISGRQPRAEAVSPAKGPNTLAIAGIAGGVVLTLLLLIVVVSSSGQPEVRKSSRTTNTSAEPPPSPWDDRSGPADKAAQSTSERKTSLFSPGPGHTPPRQDTPAPPRPASPPPPPPPQEDWSKISDPSTLRDKLAALGGRAPRDQLKRLNEMTAPEAQRVAFSTRFSPDKPDRWKPDNDSRLEFVTEEGEVCLRVTNAARELICYRHLKEHHVCQSRLVLRVFQRGLTQMKLSIQTPYGLRFKRAFQPPPEGQWTDLTFELDALTDEGVRLRNLRLGHIEVHGISEQAGAFLLLSKFEMVSGGP